VQVRSGNSIEGCLACPQVFFENESRKKNATSGKIFRLHEMFGVLVMTRPFSPIDSKQAPGST
jgi:hypothetical protein